MHYLNSAAAVVLLASSAAALPNNMRPRQTDAPNLQPWVTIGDNGKPSTVTPVLSTISGTATVISPPPNELTATVFTSYSEAAAHTSTGTVPAAPTATNTDGQGSFLKCNKPKGEPFAPFCEPLPFNVQEYRPGNTYYFTWDVEYFKSSPNTTIQIQGNYINETTGKTTTQAFQSEGVTASWGFWAFHANRELLQNQHAVNISVAMATLKPGGQPTGADLILGPKMLLSDPPTPMPKPVPAPAGPALYIGLPVILGFAMLCIFGVCIWNARHRRIELGNIMSRSRHGYGIGKSARKAERVKLMERELASDSAAIYRDRYDDRKQHNLPSLETPNRPRRDSDALDSLVGTPTEERRMDFHRPMGRTTTSGGGEDERPNRFRDELKRQEGERF